MKSLSIAQSVTSHIFAAMLCNGGRATIAKDAAVCLAASAGNLAQYGKDYTRDDAILLVTGINTEAQSVMIVDEENLEHLNAVYQAYDENYEDFLYDESQGADVGLEVLDIEISLQVLKSTDLPAGFYGPGEQSALHPKAADEIDDALYHHEQQTSRSMMH